LEPKQFCLVLHDETGNILTFVYSAKKSKASFFRILKTIGTSGGDTPSALASSFDRCEPFKKLPPQIAQPISVSDFVHLRAAGGSSDVKERNLSTS
jgi:hypothetical protein